MCFFSRLGYFFPPARVNPTDQVIVADFGPQYEMLCAATCHLSALAWQSVMTLNLSPQTSEAKKLSTVVDNFVRNFNNGFSFKFKALTGNHHG